MEKELQPSRRCESCGVMIPISDGAMVEFPPVWEFPAKNYFLCDMCQRKIRILIEEDML